MSKIPIYRSLYKPLLFVGCERLPFMIIITIGGIVIMAYQNLLAILGVFIFYLFGIFLVRRVNEDDPQYFQCLYRYLFKFQEYYPNNEFYPGKSTGSKTYLN